MSLITGLYGHVGNQILHKEEKNRRINNALAYYPREDKFLLYFTLFFEAPGRVHKNTVDAMTQH